MTDQESPQPPVADPQDPKDPQPEPPVAGAMPQPIVLVQQHPEHEDQEDGLGYTGPGWPAEALRAEVLRMHALVKPLAEFILDRLPEQINPELGEVDAPAIAVRVLDELVKYPNGRLEPAVRDAIAIIDEVPAGSDKVALVEVIRARLAAALTKPPRPGGGPAPVNETDDLTMLRYDRDRFRMELVLSYETIAQMFAAATGTSGEGPKRGVVEDLQDVHYRRMAAEEALTNAMRHRCDSEVTIPQQGTPAYKALQDLVDERLAHAMRQAQRAAAARPQVA